MPTFLVDRRRCKGGVDHWRSTLFEPMREDDNERFGVPIEAGALMGQTDVLLFVPAVVRSDNQSALRIAQLIAQSASKTRPGTYTVSSSPASTRAGVLDPAGQPILSVVQVDYFRALCGPSGADDPPRARLRDVWRAVAFAGFATWRLVAVLFSRTKPKCRNARIQVFVACAMVGLLWLSSLVLLSILIAALPLEDPGLSWSDWVPDWVPDWVTDSTVTATGAAGLLALLYWRVRDPLLATGQRLRAIMGYVERDDDLLRATGVVDQAIDEVLEDPRTARLHLLGFSFGGVLLLDALIPFAARGGERRSLDRVASVTTIGCPADFLRLLYPHHYEGRSNRLPPGVPWVNVFIPADVLGSNFLATVKDTDVSASSSGQILDTGGMHPTENIRVGRDLNGAGHLASMDGFRIHGRYWAYNEPRHLEVVVPHWLPAT